MNFLRKSLIWKLLLLVAVYAGAVALFWYFVLDGREFTGSELFGVLGGGLLLLVIGFWYFFIRPLRVVLSEMNALLGNQAYKRIFTTRIDEIGVMAHFFNQVTRGLGEVSASIKDRDRILDELSVAAQLQKDILPKQVPDVPGLEIIAKTRPATEIGGDSFNYFSVKDKTYIYIGDVTGHGAAAGLIMTMVNTLISVFADVYDNPYDILVHVNKYIKRHVKKAMFMTAVMLCFDHKTKEFSYVGAGHEHILVYHPDTGACDELLAGGVALGMVPDNTNVIKLQKIPLKNGDMVVLYSDGIIEAKNADGELFGLERLKQAVVEYGSQYGAEGVNYHVAKVVSDFAKGHEQEDDMTLIVMKRDDSFSSSKDVKDKSTNW